MLIALKSLLVSRITASQPWFGDMAAMFVAFKILAQFRTLDLTQRKEQWWLSIALFSGSHTLKRILGELGKVIKPCLKISAGYQ